MTFTTLDEFLTRFADYPPKRVRLRPIPGTATEADVLAVESAEGKLCELIDGTLVEKAMGLKESFIARRVAQRIGVFVDANKLGEVSLPDGSVKLFPGRVRIPDVAFFSAEKLADPSVLEQAIPELVPDLAIEILSPSNTRGEMFAKLKDYFFAGVRLVWYVDPVTRTADVFTGIDATTRLAEGDTLTGGDVLPGFALPLSEIWG